METGNGKKATYQFVLAGMAFLLFVLLIIVLKLIDVAPIGPEGTSVGLSHMNGAFHTLFDYSTIWYMISKVAGYLMFIIPVFFGLFGLLQLAAKKSIKKVDRPLLALFGLYAATAAVYVFFEKVIVNYRPVILPGEEHVEASFPSSHTMLACVILSSAFMLFGKYIHNETVQAVLQIVCVVLLVVIVIGRLLSGVHWLTDIIGGILISMAMLAAFVPLSNRKRKYKKIS